MVGHRSKRTRATRTSVEPEWGQGHREERRVWGSFCTRGIPLYLHSWCFLSEEVPSPGSCKSGAKDVMAKKN